MNFASRHSQTVFVVLQSFLNRKRKKILPFYFSPLFLYHFPDFFAHLTPLCMLAAFAEADFLTVPRMAQLKNYFGNLKNAWESDNPEDFLIAGVQEKAVRMFFEKKKNIIPEKSLEKIEKAGAQMLVWGEENYPSPLTKISAPPAILFVKGKLRKNDDISLAVVGTRKISPTGKHAITRFLPDLCAAGLCIVSGLARGVDAAAHREAIRCGGRTIAVLGNGIDFVYPSENRALAEDILAHDGAIFSEFFPGTPPHHFHFPRRNRIVSGLCLGTFVVEGAEKSGSLITAQFALEQNKEVFALPGNPFARESQGTNRLIQSGGAKLVLDANDILEELPLRDIAAERHIQKQLPNNPIEQEVLGMLSDEPILFDDLLQQTTIVPSQFSATLTLLEMKGFVSNLGGNRWVKK